MKKITLTKIAIAFSLCYATVQFSYAEIQSANNNTQVNRQKGVEIVNIANPSQSGLSHNQYNKFNVDKAGAVLNNAIVDTNSELAGRVAKNPNLNQQAATVILNEVVSRNPSTLLGKQEIAGQQADYVLANPSGISCDGCGFINTPRASLVVGKPNVQNGNLNGYDVTGDEALTSKGKVTGVTNLDLIAPKVNVSGEIKAEGQLNVIMGKNKIERAANGDLLVKVQPAQGQVLDGKIAGSMQAGRIRLHSTDERATLHLNNAQLAAKDVVVAAGNTKLDGEITTKTHETRHSGKEQHNVKAQTQQFQRTQQYHKTSIQGDNVIVGAMHKLDINGTDIQAKQVVLTGAETHINSQTTTNIKASSSQRSKGSWHRNESDSSTVQTIHRTTIKADNVKAIANEGKLNAQAVKIDAQNVGLYGEKGIDIKGAKEQNQYQAYASFERESVELKTGYSNQDASEQRYIASEINTEQHLAIGSQSDISLSGVKSKVDGNLVLQNKGKTQFNSETVSNSHNVDDRQKFWGGLAGAKSLTSSGNSQIQQGADFTVRGQVAIQSEQGVKLAGSRVVAGQNGFVNANKGGLVIDSVHNQVTTSESSRQGTIFNITKARQSAYQKTSTAKGSNLSSESNLKLVAGKNIDVIGSTVQAGGLLDIASLSNHNITIKGANNYAYNHNEAAGFNFNGKVEKPEINFNKDVVVDASIDAVISLIKGKTKFPEAVKKVTEVAKNNVTGKANAYVGLEIYKNQETTEAKTHSAANVVGGNTSLQANNVIIAGSKVSASEGDLNIHANKISTLAQRDQTNTHNKSTTAALKLEGAVTESSAGITFSATVDHQNSKAQTGTAQASQLSANHDVHLKADKIKHVGSQLNAGNNLIQDARRIEQVAAHNQSDSHSKNVNLGLTLTSGIDKSKVISGSLEFVVAGGRENSNESTAVSTSLNAGNNIIVNGKTINDVGTAYQAGNDVNINAQQHHLASAQNSSHKDSLSAGVTFGIEASSADLNTVDASVNLGVKFQQDQSATTNAQKATIQAGNINLHSDSLNSQADMTALHNINIQANQATFSQSSNTSNQKAGGFNAKLGVGALIIPAAGTATPSISVDVSANGKRGNTLEAVTSALKGENVSINAKQNLHLQGTQVIAEKDVNLSAQQVNIEAAHSQTQNVAVDVGTAVQLGAKASDLGVSGNFNVAHENSQNHQSTDLNGENININAESATLAGVHSQAQNLNISTENGDLNLLAVQGNTNKTNVGASLSLKGGMANSSWTPANGSGSLDVNVVRNQAHATTELNAQNANLNVNGNASLIGGSVNAENATGHIQGDVHSQVVRDKVNETNVSLVANGSGKFTAYALNNITESLKKDWESGTIAGVDADSKIEANVVRKDTNSASGINAKEYKVVIHGNVTQDETPAVRNKQVQVNIHPTTHLKQLANSFKNIPKAQNKPIISVKNN